MYLCWKGMLNTNKLPLHSHTSLSFNAILQTANFLLSITLQGFDIVNLVAVKARGLHAVCSSSSNVQDLLEETEYKGAELLIGVHEKISANDHRQITNNRLYKWLDKKWHWKHYVYCVDKNMAKKIRGVNVLKH